LTKRERVRASEQEGERKRETEPRVILGYMYLKLEMKGEKYEQQACLPYFKKQNMELTLGQNNK